MQMPSRFVVLLVAAAAVVSLAACGGSSSSPKVSQPKASQPTASTAHVAQVAAADPSASAKMICEPEAVKEVNGTLGVDTVRVSTPTWTDHVYSCDYVYPGGAKITMAVKELAGPEETTAYFNSLAEKYGKTDQALSGLGQGAFVTKNGNVVVRKDYKVLLVDVSQLPAQFGVPADTRLNDGINTATVIMSCWTGA